jgi:hypothetical protein
MSWLRSFFGVLVLMIVVLMTGFTVSVMFVIMSRMAVLVKLLRAIWAFEFMALAGNDQRTSGQKEQGKFHRRLQ